MKGLHKLDCIQQLDWVEGRCTQPVRIVVHRHRKPKPVMTVSGRMTYMYPSEYAKDGLCYYHYKKKIGRMVYQSLRK